MCSKQIKELAELSGFFDKSSSIDVKRFEYDIGYRVQMYAQIKRMGDFNTVIQPTYSRRYFTGDSLVRFLNSSNKIGSKGDPNNSNQLIKVRSNKWYSNLIDESDNLEHELDRYISFNEKLSDDLKVLYTAQSNKESSL